MYVFQRGETVVLNLEVRDAENESLVDVNSIIINLYAPNSSLIEEEAMTRNGTGLYSYDWSIPTNASIGEYKMRLNVSTPSGWIVDDVFFYVEQ